MWCMGKTGRRRLIMGIAMALSDGFAFTVPVPMRTGAMVVLGVLGGREWGWV